jgi:HK97 gp10 family phage protein
MARTRIQVLVNTRAFGQAAGRVRRDLAQAVEQSAHAIEEDVLRAVPRDTGNLAGTVNAAPVTETEWTVEEGGSTEASPEGADYAHFLEWGTRHMNSQPHFFPAVEAERGRFAGRIAEAVEKGLRGG